VLERGKRQAAGGRGTEAGRTIAAGAQRQALSLRSPLKVEIGSLHPLPCVEVASLKF